MISRSAPVARSPRRRRRAAGLAATCTGVLVLSGCLGSGPDPAPVEDEPLTPEPTSSAGAVDPCTLLDDERLAEVNPRGSEPVHTLLIGGLTFAGCTLGDTYDVSFGFRVVDDGRSLQEVVAVGGSELEGLSGVGDEGFRNGTTIGGEQVSLVVGARFGEREVLVRNDSLGNADADVRVSEEQTLELLEALGESLPEDAAARSLTVDVGAGCLPADAAEVTDLVGEVQLARGGSADGSVRCTYLGEELGTVQTARSDAPNAADFVVPDPGTTDEIDVDGALAATISEFETGTEVTVQPAEEEIAFVSASGRGRTEPFDRDQVLALVTGFLDLDGS